MIMERVESGIRGGGYYSPARRWYQSREFFIFQRYEGNAGIGFRLAQSEPGGRRATWNAVKLCYFQGITRVSWPVGAYSNHHGFRLSRRG